ncbi:MAG: cyclic nucleotide-binding domain-containing protein, partial [Deltaproteobacteria bacterium]|nr:cyclic nucleotide-binding domain-containing protein [Deltaproteobacteria bacterium]
MLSNVINNPEMKKYLVSYQTGETLFFEGDDTQDIYVLVSGRLDILKGTKKIAEIIKEGAVFGEMSFLLGEKRTATVKAMTDVEA